MERVQDTQSAMLASLRKELHELCQPATAILCMLELAKMYNDEIHMREGIDSALKECVRLVQSVHRLRLVLDGTGSGGAL